MKNTNLHRSIRAILAAVLTLAMLATSVLSAAALSGSSDEKKAGTILKVPVAQKTAGEIDREITPGEKPVKALGSTKVVEFNGDDKLDQFYAQGGAGSITDVVKFLALNLAVPAPDTSKLEGLKAYPDACSAFQVKNKENGGYYFGRNFDYDPGDMLIIKTNPKKGYKSLTSCDTSILTNSLGYAAGLIPDDLMTRIGLYIPVDGMNEKGVCVSINMINDPVVVSQDTGKTKQICTTALRTIMDRAANVDEAIDILKNCDFHTWDGFLIHLAISDASGKHVVAEWIDNKLSIIEAPIVTNFYLTPGPKYGIGTSESMTRYQILTKTLKEKPVMTETDVRDALASVAKSNFPETEHTTEWSIVYNQKTLTATYYRSEHYRDGYVIHL